MHQSDKLCLVYYHLPHDDIRNVISLKSDMTMIFSLLSPFDHDLEDGSAPEVFGDLTNTMPVETSYTGLPRRGAPWEHPRDGIPTPAI
jgi:hypothetical protein